jgi:DNA-binding phage protein
MALAAAQVIDAIAARISGLALAGNRVYTSRAWPLTEADLPAARVLAGDEEVRVLTVHPNTLQEHTLDVDIEGYVRHINTVDDAMHALAAQWLAQLFKLVPPADALNTIASKLQISLQRISRSMQAEGQATLGRIVITLRVIFRTRASAPETLV